MNDKISFIADNNMYFVFGILVFFGLIEAIWGHFINSKRNKNEYLNEIISTFLLIVFTKPVITFLSFFIASKLFPSTKNLLLESSLWFMIIVFLLVDDFLQYWYHRFAHENKLLWKWHISHHAAEEMGLLVSYRNAFLYYLFMPNIYWLGIFTFLGGGIAVAIGVVLKQLVIIASHSLVTWDSFFHKRKIFLPILKILERIIITPAFHHAHHAKSIVDDIGNPNGNFGNMFSIWDQIFGTAKFTHAFPSNYGLQADPKDTWYSYIFYPLVKSKKIGSELSKEYKFEKTTRLEPSTVHLNPGDYLYCKCGFSNNQPFCDGSHHGTKFQPEKFSIKRVGDYKLCNCKLNKRGPFCDNSHLKL